MAAIESVHGRQVLDSRGNPTVEVEVLLDSGARGLAAVPSGASTGEYEAVELRDGGDEYGGKAVGRAVANVNGEIADALRGADPADQRALDRTMIDLDGTPNKSRLGANAILGASVAAAKAAADEAGVPLYEYFGELYAATGAHAGPAVQLPVPMMNVLNGGAHADNNVDFQEFMVVPVGRGELRRGLRCGRRDLPRAAGDPEQEGASTRRGRRGRLRAGPRVQPGRARLPDRRDRVGRLCPGGGPDIALDPATSELFRRRRTTCSSTRGRTLTPAEMADYWHDVRTRFPIVSIEDGMDEEDWDGWKALTERIGDLCQLVGDDLFVTNPERLRRGIELGVANSILIKLNQIGTLSETLEAIQIARDAGYTTVISHRSGETEDTTIADLAVGTGAGQIKTGAPVALGPGGEVQPPAADRGGARRSRRVPRRVHIHVGQGMSGRAAKPYACPHGHMHRDAGSGRAGSAGTASAGSPSSWSSSASWSPT